jgi:hypothetical protein
MKLVRISLVAMLATVTFACGGERPTEPAGDASPPTVPSDVRGTIDLGGAVIDAPDGWEFSQPSSSMRLAEATIPGPGGPALLTVFFFGAGGGGGVDANLARWVGQVEADGEPERGEFSVGDFTVTTVAVDGTLLPSGMGAGPTEPVPGSSVVGAVIQGPGGPWFLKVTGPEETVDSARDAFDRMLRSVRAGS